MQRPRVSGKFLYVGNEKLWVRGVTYGAFRPDVHGNEYHNLEIIERDFAQMAASGLNTVRIPHTMPPVSLLDAAQRHGLRVMVGLSAEQYVGYLIDKKDAPDIEAVVRTKVRPAPATRPSSAMRSATRSQPPWCAGSAVAAWSGTSSDLYWAVKAEDPEGLVTYVNYPTTEYLQLPFLDLVCFNVYLEIAGAL